jgi:hypothetical protein
MQDKIVISKNSIKKRALQEQAAYLLKYTALLHSIDAIQVRNLCAFEKASTSLSFFIKRELRVA